MKILFMVLTMILAVTGIRPTSAVAFNKIAKPPLAERWFGIYMDSTQKGFYHQKIEETSDGYRMVGESSIRITVMGFSRVADMHEVYVVGKNLSLRSLDVEQTINGITSRLYGKVGDGIIRIKCDNNRVITDRQLRFKGEVYPGSALNLYPMMRDLGVGKSFNIQIFDSEEIRIKEVKVTVLGEDKTPDGRSALKLRNNLYPFVNNDIWMDGQGNTIIESVREGLVTTKAEDPKVLGAFIGNMALSKKDLIHDFSVVRIEPPIKNQKNLKGLVVMISGWNDSLPLFQDGGQLVEKSGGGSITIRTGSAVPLSKAVKPATSHEIDLKTADKIEVDAPEIVAKTKQLAAGKKSPEDVARSLSAWTTDWLKDTLDDTGSALASFKSRSGNCQTHARLYTALARAAGIPTRFVSGLVYLEGKGFLYHSWAESLLGGRWIAIDPFYNQLPADPTHLKLFEGHLPEDMLPIIAIIGKIKITVQEAKY
ncbi:MAG: transglutaminase domain-containing protein [Desulfuromonadales bacterium]|nr:transglutaminase domain-containing protein [Desulfuromonadales bacterium]